MSSGKRIQLVIFDWAGTTIDFGSCAPVSAFMQVFAANGIDVTPEEARGPMGLNKREHLVAMLNQPRIAESWQRIHGASWEPSDVDKMYNEFAALQLEAIQQHSQLVPHLLETVEELRNREIRIAGTTGYFHEAAEVVAKNAKAAGFCPDTNVCADDVPQGRPAPWMIYRAMEQLRISPADTVLKVGDTVADIQAGLNAGCWSVGVCDSSSLNGQSLETFASLSSAEQAASIARASQRFQDAGCHATIGTISELPKLIDEIDRKLQEQSDSGFNRPTALRSVPLAPAT